MKMDLRLIDFFGFSSVSLSPEVSSSVASSVSELGCCVDLLSCATIALTERRRRNSGFGGFAGGIVTSIL